MVTPFAGSAARSRAPGAVVAGERPEAVDRTPAVARGRCVMSVPVVGSARSGVSSVTSVPRVARLILGPDVTSVRVRLGRAVRVARTGALSAGSGPLAEPMAATAAARARAIGAGRAASGRSARAAGRIAAVRRPTGAPHGSEAAANGPIVASVVIARASVRVADSGPVRREPVRHVLPVRVRARRGPEAPAVRVAPTGARSVPGATSRPSSGCATRVFPTTSLPHSWTRRRVRASGRLAGRTPTGSRVT